MKPLKHLAIWLTIGGMLVAAVVFFSLSPQPVGTMDLWGDKLHHLFAYFVLMFWFAQIYVPGRRHFYLAVIFILMGVGLELLQGISGLRRGDPVDVLWNVAGVLAAWSLARTRWANALVVIERMFVR